ncbi:SDR family NAD(P)-dependent oxidoreductase [Planctomicrobium sp. SH664]|uniref:SDR family NAD(P)-dependent oxidoreductase n=1 Tax=Planctomicrobium sp. SH664 TaxID=3448125 RepID=UPI003F5AE11E
MDTLLAVNGHSPKAIRPLRNTLEQPTPQGNRLRGKTAIITGAGSGIGRTMAQVFCDEGAQVVIADIAADTAQRAAQELSDLDAEALGLTVDVTRPDQVEMLMERTLERFGKIDVLVNNAGVGLNKTFLDTTLDDWNRLLNVVLTGTFICSQAAARRMTAAGKGSIVNIASISGQKGAQGRTAYGSAKAGVIQLTRTMGVELARYGVRVNAVSPGPVVTPQSSGTHTAATRQSYLDRIPLNRYGERVEVAAAALFLASDESSFIQGHILNVDGGFYSAGLMFDPEAD